MQHTSLYLTATDWVLTSMSRTRAGVWVANLVVHRLAADCGDSDLGGAVLESLGASHLDVPHPDSLPAHHRRLREELGVMSLDGFLGRARLLAIHRVQSAVVLTAHRNRGTQHGFEPLPGKLTLQSPEPSALGEAVRRCADQCE
jgi:hypothetical protein